MQTNTKIIIAVMIGVITFTLLIVSTYYISGYYDVEIPNTPTDSNDFMEGFPLYAFEVVSDMILAVLLGLGVNGVTNFIANWFGLAKYGKISVQLLFITIVLYVMKIDSKYLYSSWKGQTSYGIIFTAVFLAVQKNMTSFIESL